MARGAIEIRALADADQRIEEIAVVGSFGRYYQISIGGRHLMRPARTDGSPLAQYAGETDYNANTANEMVRNVLRRVT
jgi:hypothetical protein